MKVGDWFVGEKLLGDQEWRGRALTIFLALQGATVVGAAASPHRSTYAAHATHSRWGTPAHIGTNVTMQLINI